VNVIQTAVQSNDLHSGLTFRASKRNMQRYLLEHIIQEKQQKSFR